MSPSENENGSYSDGINFDSEPDEPQYEALQPVPFDHLSFDDNIRDNNFLYGESSNQNNSNENIVIDVQSYVGGSPDCTISTQSISSTNTSLTNMDISSPNTKIIIKGRKRKHNCVYCDVLVYNFGRHLERQHSDETEVQRFLQMEKNNPQRKQIINKVRKEGDFCSSKPLPVQGKKRKCQVKRQDEQETDSENDETTCTLLPCTHCKGYYARKTLRRHVKRCHFNSKSQTSTRSRPQAEGHTLMSDHFGPNDPLRTSGVLKTLKADEISLVAKRDKIICEVARKYVKSHKDKHLIVVARRYMRRLATLLIEVRNIEKNKSLQFSSILHPSKFKSIIQATRRISGYDPSGRTFKSSSMALQLGTTIKKAINAAYSIEVQKNIASPSLGILDSMKKLIEEEWATEISIEASQNLNLNRFNKPTLMPVAEDIYKMKMYLDELLLNAKIKLSQNNKDEDAYKTIIEGSYCSLLLFNKRRVGELQRILLNTYLNVQKNEPSGDFEKLLSPTEKILIKKLKRIVIRGKRGRGVPVLFDKVTIEALELAVRLRNNFYESYNTYLFGTCHSESCISGYHVFRKHVQFALGDPNKTRSLTSTKLRKHLATMAQILKMDNEDLEQLASFMGHTTKTHNEWYRLPSDIYQTAKVSKILLLAQNNSVDQYKGCSLNELDVEEDILQDDSDSECEGNERFKEVDTLAVELPSTSTRIMDNQIKKRVLKKWSAEAKRATEKFFAYNISKNIPPKKKEVEKLISTNPSLFQGRNWQSIKVYVCNIYSKKDK